MSKKFQFMGELDVTHVPSDERRDEFFAALGLEFRAMCERLLNSNEDTHSHRGSVHQGDFVMKFKQVDKLSQIAPRVPTPGTQSAPSGRGSSKRRSNGPTR